MRVGEKWRVTGYTNWAAPGGRRMRVGTVGVLDDEGWFIDPRDSYAWGGPSYVFAAHTYERVGTDQPTGAPNQPMPAETITPEQVKSCLEMLAANVLLITPEYPTVYFALRRDAFDALTAAIALIKEIPALRIEVERLRAQVEMQQNEIASLANSNDGLEHNYNEMKTELDRMRTELGWVRTPDDAAVERAAEALFAENMIHDDDASPEWCKSFWKGESNGPHCGDCTGIPMTCSRCVCDDYRRRARAVLTAAAGEQS